MPIIAFNKIIFDKANRDRQEYGEAEITSLRHSFVDIGLLHPITIRSIEDPVLVAGGRRYTAFQSFFKIMGPTAKFRYNGQEYSADNFPVNVRSTTGHFHEALTELAENIERVDLTWQERTQAEAKLHKIRTGQFGAKTPENPQGWTRTDTVRELNHDISPAPDATEKPESSAPVAKSQLKSLKDSLTIEPWMHLPEVANAPNRKVALKAIEDHLASILKDRRASEYIPEETHHTLLHGDCIELLDTIPERFDVLLTDPPYGMGIDKHDGWENRINKTEARHDYDDSEENATVLISQMLRKMQTLLKEECHLYIFCDIDLFPTIRSLYLENGFTPFRTPLIWSKGNQGGYPWAETGPRRTYECIAYAIRGGKKVNKMYHDVLSIDQQRNLDHPAQKPVELYEALLQKSSIVGDSVIDQLCGSGPIFPAAESLSLFETGIEMNEKYLRLAQARLAEIQN